MNLLLVDDEIAMIQIMKETIDWKRLGIQKLFTAYNSDEARDILESSAVDILLCDIEMPGESGLGLIKWMQNVYPGIICIILTGYPDFNYARSAISLGVYQYLLKPVAFEELEMAVRSAIERAEEAIADSRNSRTEAKEDMDSMRIIKEYLEAHYNEVITRKK